MERETILKIDELEHTQKAEEQEFMLEKLMEKFEKIEIATNANADKTIITSIHSENHQDGSWSPMWKEMADYEINYTVKQLLMICDYYEIFKGKRFNVKQLKKHEIIQHLIFFENEPGNFELVERRKLAWEAMEFLRKDKFMKKYIVWPTA